MSTTTGRAHAAAPAAVSASRSVLAALLAVVTTFWPLPERTAAFGLAALGAYLLAQAIVLAAGARWVPDDRAGRALTGARAVASLVAGVVALAGIERAAGLFVPLAAVTFLLVGALEVVGGIRRSVPDTAGDAIVVGGLQVVVGLILVIVNPGALLAIGVLSAWSAVVAVYLGIAAANLRRRGSRA